MFDIEDFLNRHFDDVIQGDNDYKVCCPFCDDSKFHMYVGMDKRAVHCFKCGYSGSWIGLVVRMTGYPYWRAIGELYEKPRMVDYKERISIPEPVIEEKAEASLPLDYERLDGACGKIADKAREYLTARGFTFKYWKIYGLGVAASVFGRIIIPIEGGYWQGRRIFKNMEPKYINPKVEARDIIFNAKALTDYHDVVICEGAFSAMAVGTNAIALIGKEPTDEKISRILSAINVERFIIALEPEAWGTMSKLADALHNKGRKVLLWKYSVGDPADPQGKFEEIEYNFKTKVSLQMDTNTLVKSRDRR